jgi:hypothetical protein
MKCTLDSADIRKNIVSLAKMLGYTPTSPKSPTASIDILVNNASGTSITMAKGTTFTTSVDGTTYQFVTNALIQLHQVLVFTIFQVYQFTKVL